MKMMLKKLSTFLIVLSALSLTFTGIIRAGNESSASTTIAPGITPFEVLELDPSFQPDPKFFRNAMGTDWDNFVDSIKPKLKKYKEIYHPDKKGSAADKLIEHDASTHQTILTTVGKSVRDKVIQGYFSKLVVYGENFKKLKGEKPSDPEKLKEHEDQWDTLKSNVYSLLFPADQNKPKAITDDEFNHYQQFVKTIAGKEFETLSESGSEKDAFLTNMGNLLKRSVEDYSSLTKQEEDFLTKFKDTLFNQFNTASKSLLDLPTFKDYLWALRKRRRESPLSTTEEAFLTKYQILVDVEIGTRVKDFIKERFPHSQAFKALAKAKKAASGSSSDTGATSASADNFDTEIVEHGKEVWSKYLDSKNYENLVRREDKIDKTKPLNPNKTIIAEQADRLHTDFEAWYELNYTAKVTRTTAVGAPPITEHHDTQTAHAKNLDRLFNADWERNKMRGWGIGAILVAIGFYKVFNRFNKEAQEERIAEIEAKIAEYKAKKARKIYTREEQFIIENNLREQFYDAYDASDFKSQLVMMTAVAAGAWGLKQIFLN